MSMSTDFIKARIAATESIIVKYEEAIVALTSGAQSYKIETGQDSQTVTRADIDKLQSSIKESYILLDTLYARYSPNRVTVRPVW